MAGTSEQMGQRSRKESDRSSSENDRRQRDKWTDQKFEKTRFPFFEGARIQRERITKQDIEKFGATVGCQGCNAIKDNKRAQAHSDRCRERIERCLRITPQGAERLDRRNEVISDALAEEVREQNRGKGEQMTQQQ